MPRWDEVALKRKRKRRAAELANRIYVVDEGADHAAACAAEATDDPIERKAFLWLAAQLRARRVRLEMELDRL